MKRFAFAELAHNSLRKQPAPAGCFHFDIYFVRGTVRTERDCSREPRGEVYHVQQYLYL